jgi:hypothetical protein
MSYGWKTQELFVLFSAVILVMQFVSRLVNVILCDMFILFPSWRDCKLGRISCEHRHLAS